MTYLAAALLTFILVGKTITVSTTTCRLTRIISNDRGRWRSGPTLALAIVDPPFQCVDLRADQLVVLRSAVAHSGNVVHRKHLPCCGSAKNMFHQRLVSRGFSRRDDWVSRAMHDDQGPLQRSAERSTDQLLIKAGMPQAHFDNSTSSRAGSAPLRSGIRCPCGSVSGSPNFAAMRSLSRSEMKCSSRSASS